MKLSQLIERLSALLREQGDGDVVVVYDTGSASSRKGESIGVYANKDGTVVVDADGNPEDYSPAAES